MTTASQLCLLLTLLWARNPVGFGQHLAPLNASSGETPGRASLDSQDHRVIIPPGKWKIRMPGRNPFLVYHFFLGLNLTHLQVEYPDCSQVACTGLTEDNKSNQRCDRLCSSGSWNEAELTLNTAKREYTRATSSLAAAFGDVATLVDVLGLSNTLDPGVFKLLANRGSGSQVVDVMRPYRRLIDDALTSVAEHLPSAAVKSVHSPPVLGSNDTSAFNELLDTWKSGALQLAVQLNAVTFALQGAHRRLLSCAQGVKRSDMTGCEPKFITEYYTDVPVASRSLSSRLIVVVERAHWKPVVLSRWYMAFIDSSHGNRTCWLDRPMVCDADANYRVPSCDLIGICEPLVVDNTTVPACLVNQRGEIGSECPVVCGHSCLGPVCYQPQWDTYTLRTAPEGAHGVFATTRQVEANKSPRIVSRVYFLSEAEMHTSIASVRDRADRSSQLLERGETVLQTMIAMDRAARKYTDKIHAKTIARSQGCVDCERAIARIRFMGAASVTLSALTCTLLIVIITTLKCSGNRRVPVRIDRGLTEPLL